MLIEQLGAQVVARRTGQLVVAERRIVVEEELVVGVGGVEPQLVGSGPATNSDFDHRGAEARFHTLMYRTVSVVTEQALKKARYVRHCGSSSISAR